MHECTDVNAAVVARADLLFMFVRSFNQHFQRTHPQARSEQDKAHHKGGSVARTARHGGQPSGAHERAGRGGPAPESKRYPTARARSRSACIDGAGAG